MPKKCLTKCSKTVGVGIVTVRKAHLELVSLNSSGKVVKEVPNPSKSIKVAGGAI